MKKTFEDFDKYGLMNFANQLTTYLQVESKFVDESFVLSLNSKFGSGKSTFFEMWVDKLNEGKDTFKVVEINAWEADFQGDPLLAIVSNLTGILQEDGDMEQIKEAAGKLGKFALSLGNDIVRKTTGLDFINAGEYAESKPEADKIGLGHACFDLYRGKQELFENLKKSLRELTCKSELPILVIVDELDRCRPNYAIEFLETIKHIFDIKGLVFVIGVDKTQLASSAKALFGQELIFDEYYRKFAHRNVSLPVTSSAMTESFCRELVREYLSEDAFGNKGRFSYAKYDEYRIGEIVDICKAFSLNARQMHESFRITAHSLSITAKPDSHLLWGWSVGTFFMTALSINNNELYEQIGKSKITMPEFTAFLKRLSLLSENRNGADRWAAILYLGVFGKQPLDKLEQEFQELGVWGSGAKDGAFQEELERYGQAFNRFGEVDDPVFPKIYETLEGLKTFESR